MPRRLINNQAITSVLTILQAPAELLDHADDVACDDDAGVLNGVRYYWTMPFVEKVLL